MHPQLRRPRSRRLTSGRGGLKITSSVLALVVATGIVAACSDDDSSDSASSSTTSAAAADTATTTTTPEPAAAPAAPPSSGVSGSDGVPAITANSTDLTKEPKIAAGGATPPTGLVIADLVTGQGRTAVSTDTVNVQYTGVLYSDGQVFDGTWQRGGQPTSFSLSEVVAGFTQGITGMKIGGRREIVIPPDLGYGADTKGPIPGGSTLVFVVDLVAIA